MTTYQVKKTDGTLLTEVVEETINQTKIDLTIIGKNYTPYGLYLNENFVKLLENFSDTKPPTRPIDGQLWFDSAAKKIKIYSGTGWKLIGGPIVSPVIPWNLTRGDIWINNETDQMFFYDGFELALAGPIYTKQQGVSGFVTETALDTNGVERVISKVFSGTQLLGIFSSYATPFELLFPTSQFEGTVYPGFNQSILQGFRFHSNVAAANGLIDDDPAENGAIRTVRDFMLTGRNTGTTGTITLSNPIPLILGDNQNVTVTASNTDFRFDVNSTDIPSESFSIFARNNNILTVNPVTNKITVFNAAEDPNSAMSVGGNFAVNSIVDVYDTISKLASNTVPVTSTSVTIDSTEDYSGFVVNHGVNKDLGLRWNDDIKRWEVSFADGDFTKLLICADFARVACTGVYEDLVLPKIWFQGTTGIYTPATKVGVNTNNPQCQLDVVGNVYAKATFSGVGTSTPIPNVTINLATGDFFTVNVTQPTTITFTDTICGKASFVVRVIRNGRHSITWNSNIEWPYGQEPEWEYPTLRVVSGNVVELTSPPYKTDLYCFHTLDNGVTWIGALLGKDFKQLRNYHWINVLSGGELVHYSSSINLDADKNVYAVGTTATEVSLLISEAHNLSNASPTNFANAASSLTALAGTLTGSSIQVSPPSAGDEYWISTIGGTSADSAYAIVHDSQGFAYIIGDTASAGPGGTSMALIKLDSFGQIVWQRAIGGASNDLGRNITIDSSNNLYISGITNSVGTGGEAFVAKVDSATGNILWQTSLGATGLDAAYSVAVDLSGNVFICGETPGGGIDLFLAKLNSSGASQWQRRVGITNRIDYGYGVTTDSTGAVYVCGATNVSSQRSFDATVMKFDTNGTRLWDRVLRTSGNGHDDVAYDIAVDSSNNVYICGASSSSGLFMLVKFNSSGTVLWQKTFTGQSIVARSLFVDSSNNVLVTGTQSNTTLFLAKFDSLGNVLLQKTVAASGTDTARGISSNSAGDIFVCGGTTSSGSGLEDMLIAKLPPNTTKTGIFGAFTVSNTNYTVANSAVVLEAAATTVTNITLTSNTPSFSSSVINLSRNIVPISDPLDNWIANLSSANDARANGVTMDTAGNVYVVGTSQPTNQRKSDMLVAKYSSVGERQWQTLIGSNSDEVGMSVAVDSLGNVYACGSTAGAGAGRTDVLVVKLNGSGVIQWQRVIGTSLDEIGNSIKLDSQGNIIIAGTTGGRRGVGLIMKLSPTGQTLWLHTVTSGGTERGYSVSIDALDNVYLCGDTVRPGRKSDIMIVKYDTTGVLLWQRILIAPIDDFGYSSAVDSQGNIYVVGQLGRLEQGNTTLAFLTKFDSEGLKIWSRTLGGAFTDAAYSVSIDSNNNVVVAGTVGLSNNTRNMLFAKFDTEGNFMWQRSLRRINIDVANSVSLVDGVDSFAFCGIYQVGNNNNDIIVGKLPLDGTLTGTYGSYVYATSNLTVTSPDLREPDFNVVMSKYNNSGIVQWRRCLDYSFTDKGVGIKVDPDGNVFLIAESIEGRNSTHVVKYNPFGEMLWQRLVTTNNSRQAEFLVSAVGIDSLGHIYVSRTVNEPDVTREVDLAYVMKMDPDGTYNSQFRFTNGSDQSSQVNAMDVTEDGIIHLTGASWVDGEYQGYIVKCTNTPGLPAGIIWQRSFRLPGYELFGRGIAVDRRDGSIYAAMLAVRDADTDGYLAKYDVNGNFLWKIRIPNILDGTNLSVAVGDSGEVALLGTTINVQTFIFKFDDDGNVIWQQQMTTVPFEKGNSVYVDTCGDIYMAASVPFPDNDIYSDALIAKLSMNAIKTTSVTIAGKTTTLSPTTVNVEKTFTEFGTLQYVFSLVISNTPSSSSGLILGQSQLRDETDLQVSYTVEI
jgi:uncharacterized delta-60 repeat protein